MAIKFLSNESIDGTLEVGSFTVSGSGIVAAVGMTLQVDAGSVNAITIDNVGTVTTSGYLKIPNYLFHDGDTDTRLQFGTGTITLRGDSGITLDGPVTTNAAFNLTGGIITLGVADTSSGHINAYENLTFNIDIDNDDTTRYFGFYTNGSDGSGTELVRIAEDGNVAIQPGGATLTNTRLYVVSADNYNPSLYDGMGGIRIGSGGGSSAGDGNYTGGIGFAITSGTSGIAGVQKGADADKQGLAFFTHPSTTGGDAAVEKMRLDADGNVGIGTTGPTSKLHVVSDEVVLGSVITDYRDLAIQVETSQTTANSGTGISFDHGALGAAIASARVDNNNWGTDLRFYTHPAATTNQRNVTERMRIDSEGNVGIGTTTPQERLHIVGLDGSVPLSSYYGSLVVDNNGEAAMSIIGNSYSSIYFGDAATNFAGGVIYEHSSNSMNFRVNGNSEKMRIASDGTASLGNTSPESGVQLTVRRPNDLGNNVGDYQRLAAFQNSVSNFNQLYINSVRDANGTDWTTQGMRLSMKVDSTWMGYMQFNGSGNGAGISFGTGTTTTSPGSVTERMRITSGGNVGIGTVTPYSSLSVIDNNSFGYFSSTSAYRTATFQGSGSTSIVVAADGNSNGVYSEIRLGNTQATYANYSPYVRATQGNGIDTYSLEFGTSAFGVASTVMYIGGATGTVKGNVGIGTTAPAQKLSIFGGGSTSSTLEIRGGSTGADNATISTQQSMTFQIGSAGATGRSFGFKKGGLGYSDGTQLASISDAGTFTAVGDVVAYSDKKLKKNIKTLDGSKVYEMRGVSFDRIDTNKASSGVIAQEIQEIAPELISESNGTLGVAYGNISGYLIEAIKELKAEIEGLKSKPCACNNCNCKE
jgi:hypothetical protein